MGKVNYLLLDMSVLPEVYVKVIEAKGYLQSGEAANASQAIKMAGISCSAYYKYKDKIFEYSEQGDDATTINAKLQDNAGVLSSVMNELYLAGANILAVNQSKENKKEFLRGYDYMLSKIEPEAVIDGVNLLLESIRQTTPVTCFRFDNCFYYIRFLLFLQSPYMIF